MGKAEQLRNKLDVPTKKHTIKGMEVDFAQLNVARLDEVDQRIDKDIWDLLTGLFSGEIIEAVQEAQEEGRLEELREEGLDDIVGDAMDQKAMMGLVKELDYSVQLNVAWESLKVGFDSQTTKKQAANIFSFGLSDDEQLDVIMFCLQGPTPEQVEEKADEGKKVKSSTSGGGQSVSKE